MMSVDPAVQDGAHVPQLSVLLSVYNGERYLREAVDSILEQSFRDFELIVVDDASTDATPAMLEEYAGRDGRVRVIRNDVNRRLPASLNRGLEFCRAPLIARADADDVYHPARFEKQVAFMTEHPDVGVASCAVERIDADGKYLATHPLPVSDEEIRFQMLFTCPISHPGVIFRRTLVTEAGGYDPYYERCEDYELWIRLGRQTRFANLAEPLVRYRLHGSSETQIRSDEERTVLVSLKQRLLSEYLGRPVATGESIALHALLRRRHEHLDIKVINAGLKVLRELMERAERVQSRELLRTLKLDVADALQRQALKQSSSRRRLSLRLLGEIVRIDPRYLLTPRGSIQLLRVGRGMVRRGGRAVGAS